MFTECPVRYLPMNNSNGLIQLKISNCYLLNSVVSYGDAGESALLLGNIFFAFRRRVRKFLLTKINPLMVLRAVNLLATPTSLVS